MEYWFCISNEENWQIIKKANVWGVSEHWKKRLEQIKPGDHLVLYVKQIKEKHLEIVPPRIVGIFEVVSKPYSDKQRLFKSHKEGEIYPFRIKIKPIKIAEKIISFRELIPKASFIKNKWKWSLSMRITIRPISEKDYKLIKGQFGT